MLSGMSHLSFFFLSFFSRSKHQELTSFLVLVLVLPSTSPLFLSILRLRFLSWLETLPVTTRRPVSFPAIFSLPSVSRSNPVQFGPKSHNKSKEFYLTF